MKILITADTYCPAINGVVTSICNLRRALTALGHEVRILTLAPQADRSERKGDVYYLRSFRCAIYPDARLTIAFRDPLLREIESWEPDIIHSQSEFSSFFCAKHLSRRLSIPLVHTYHTLYEDYTEYFSPSKTLGVQAVRHITRHLSRSVSFLCAPSIKVQQTLLRYRVHAPVLVLPTGIDLSRFGRALAPDVRRAMKQALDLPTDSRILLSVGRLAAEKSYDVLLRSVATVLREKADVYLLLVGDGPYRGELETQIRQLGLTDKVRFTGMVPSERVPDYYRLGDLFVCASTSETQGLTYLEAMASGLPQVVRQDDCLRGVVENGINGYQFENDAQCTDHLTALLADKPQREHFSENATKLSQRFGMDAFGARAAACYQALIDSATPVRSGVFCE